MSRNDSLLQLRKELIGKIDRLGPMRKGSVTKQMLPYKRKDGSKGRRGPYFTYTFKEGARTKGRHLRNEEEAAFYQQQIERFRSFQELSRQFVETSQAVADAEVESRQCKKNSREKFKKKSSGKSGK